MNRNILTLIFLIGSIGFSFSQEISENALGLRLGDDDGFGAEISYQRKIKETNRLEVDLGIRNGRGYDAFKLAGIYQWVWQLDGNFNWYAGVGGGFASFDIDNRFNDDDFFDGRDNKETALFVAGDIGIEYNFDIPLLLSIDFRPELGFGDFDDDLGFDIALGLRYQF